jgi:hypothetical protein
MAIEGRCPPHCIRARLIPDDNNGALAIIRKVAGVLGAEPSSRITDGVSIKEWRPLRSPLCPRWRRRSAIRLADAMDPKPMLMQARNILL